MSEITEDLLALAANDDAVPDGVFRVLAAALTGQPFEWEHEDASTWTVCEGGCDRALPATRPSTRAAGDEAEHAQCGSLLVYCSDCLADHARGCLVCGAE